MTTFTHKDILSHEAKRAAMFFQAYKECAEEVRAIVDEMLDVINDPDCDEDDRTHAADVMLDALFPGLSAEMIELDEIRNVSAHAVNARAELDAEEDSFAERVKSLMSEKGMTQETLAELTGVGQPAIANMLNRNCRPQRRTIKKFADVFGVNPRELWPWNGE